MTTAADLGDGLRVPGGLPLEFRERLLNWTDPRSFHFDVPAEAGGLIQVLERIATPAECHALLEIYRPAGLPRRARGVR